MKLRSINNNIILNQTFLHDIFIKRRELIELLNSKKLSKSLFLDKIYNLFTTAEINILIDNLIDGSLKKDIFIDKLKHNLELILESNKSDMIEDLSLKIYTLMYQYSFYNAVAKKILNLISDYEFRDLRKYLNIRKIAFNIYEIKEAVSLKILEQTTDFKAYPILLNNGMQITEIIFLRYDDIILHIHSDYANQIIKKSNQYTDFLQKSAIDYYVNSKNI